MTTVTPTRRESTVKMIEPVYYPTKHSVYERRVKIRCAAERLYNEGHGVEYETMETIGGESHTLVTRVEHQTAEELRNTFLGPEDQREELIEAIAHEMACMQRDSLNREAFLSQGLEPVFPLKFERRNNRYEFDWKVLYEEPLDLEERESVRFLGSMNDISPDDHMKYYQEPAEDEYLPGWEPDAIEVSYGHETRYVRGPIQAADPGTPNRPYLDPDTGALPTMVTPGVYMQEKDESLFTPPEQLTEHELRCLVGQKGDQFLDAGYLLPDPYDLSNNPCAMCADCGSMPCGCGA